MINLMAKEYYTMKILKYYMGKHLIIEILIILRIIGLNMKAILKKIINKVLEHLLYKMYL